VNGIPHSTRATTLSLPPAAIVGRWPVGHREHVSSRLVDVGCGNQLPLTSAPDAPDPETVTLHQVGCSNPGGHRIMTVRFMRSTHRSPYDFFRFTHYGLRDLRDRHGLDVVTPDARDGGVLLTAHCAVLSVVGVLMALAATLGPLGWLVDDMLVPALVRAPQVLARRLPGTRLRGTAKRASLGDTAVARKPVPSMRSGTAPEVAGATVG